MGRGVSSGGGQSSLGYLFGSDQPPRTAPLPPTAPDQVTQEAPKPRPAVTSNAPTATIEGPPSRTSNNYHRAEGQNAGNFITDRPSTRVHSAPGGGSSLGYLFGGQK